MGQVRHGSATTTHAVRAAIQRSQASLSTLSREFGINPKTLAKLANAAVKKNAMFGGVADLRDEGTRRDVMLSFAVVMCGS